MFIKHSRRIVVASLLVLWCSLAFSPAIAEISFGVALLAYLFWKASKQPFTFHPSASLLTSLGILFFITVLSAIGSEFPLKSLRGILKLAQQIMLFVMVSDVFYDPKDRRRFEVVFLFFYTVLIFDALYQCGIGTDFIRGFRLQPASSGARITASFKSYGLLAAYLLITLPYCFYLGQSYLTHGRRRLGLLSLSLFSFGLTVLFFTRSRGAYLSAFLGSLAILIIYGKWRWIAILGLLGGLALLLTPKNMVIHLDQFGREQSLVERYYLWDRAVKVIQARPLLGTGINTYTVAHKKYDKTFNWRVQGYYAHNGYLQMAAETGLLGLGAFLFFIAQYFRFSLARTKIHEQNYPSWESLALLMGSINFLCFAVVDTVLHNPLPVMQFWYWMGLHCALLSHPSISKNSTHVAS